MTTEFSNVADLLLHAGRTFPDKIGVADRDRLVSFSEIAGYARAVADHLEGLGIVAGDRVALVVDKQIEVVAAMFGCFLSGAILVPVNPQLKPRQIDHILSDSGSRVVIGTSRRALVLEQVDPGRALAAIVTEDCDVRPLRGNAALPGRRAPAAGFEDLPLATLFYTSGSTGLPKAVACTHSNIIAGAQSVSMYLENSETDVILAILPLSFDAGFSQLTTGFMRGARIVLQDYLLPADISRTCQRHAVTGITGVPAIWNAALRAKWSEKARFDIRYFANTGGHLSHQRIQELVELFPNARPYPMYGLTEAFRSSYLDPDMVWEKPGSIGKAIPDAVLCVIDENGEECPDNQPGELVHAGPTVAAGYWNNPQETQKRFRPAPPALVRLGHTGTVVFSGDLVRRDPDGFLFYETRMDGQIKISGNRISFAEIEEVALSHPGVRASAAGGWKFSAEADPELLLFVETDGSDTVVEEVTEMLRRELPGFAVPSRIFTRSRLLLNNNNKYDVKGMIAEHCNETSEGTSSGTG